MCHGRGNSIVPDVVTYARILASRILAVVRGSRFAVRPRSLAGQLHAGGSPFALRGFVFQSAGGFARFVGVVAAYRVPARALLAFARTLRRRQECRPIAPTPVARYAPARSAQPTLHFGEQRATVVTTPRDEQR